MNRLEVRDANKFFAEKHVLKNVSFTVAPGKMHGLVGSNGAGKSTLARILFGDLSMDSGELLFDGAPYDPTDIWRDTQMGISLVNQDVQLFPHLRVYENLLIGQRHCGGSPRGILPGKKRQLEQARALLQKIKLDIDPNRLLTTLSPTERRLVKFASAISADLRLLILDEVTAGLNPREAREILEVLRQCCARGTSVLFLSHNILEVMESCDHISVIRDGEIVGSQTRGESHAHTIFDMMQGKTVKSHFPKTPVEPGEALIEVRDLRTGFLSGINFTLRAGEILGIAGLLGSGRTNLVKAISGIEKILQGEIVYHDAPPDYHGERAKIGILPENQSISGLFPNLSVSKNITITNLNRVKCGKLLLSTTKEAVSARDIMERVGVQGSSEQPIAELSSGNKQKSLIARCVYSNSRLLLFDDPCCGVDAAGKVAVYNLISQLARKGCAIILVSSDFTELIGMCDSLLVLNNGRQIAQIPSGEATEELLYAYTAH